MNFRIRAFKPSGKLYAEDSIVEEGYCLYTKIPKVVELKYKNKIEEGWLILVEDESGAAHIFKKE